MQQVPISRSVGCFGLPLETVRPTASGDDEAFICQSAEFQAFRHYMPIEYPLGILVRFQRNEKTPNATPISVSRRTFVDELTPPQTCFAGRLPDKGIREWDKRMYDAEH